jgi:hypothetical protein
MVRTQSGRVQAAEVHSMKRKGPGGGHVVLPASLISTEGEGRGFPAAQKTRYFIPGHYKNTLSGVIKEG